MAGGSRIVKQWDWYSNKRNAGRGLFDERLIQWLRDHENTGGGEPIPRFHKWTVEERVNDQPRTTSGQFCDYASVGKETKYPKRGKNRIPFILRNTVMSLLDLNGQLDKGGGRYADISGAQLASVIKAGTMLRRDDVAFVVKEDITYEKFISKMEKGMLDTTLRRATREEKKGTKNLVPEEYSGMDVSTAPSDRKWYREGEAEYQGKDLGNTLRGDKESMHDELSDPYNPGYRWPDDLSLTDSQKQKIASAFSDAANDFGDDLEADDLKTYLEDAQDKSGKPMFDDDTIDAITQEVGFPGYGKDDELGGGSSAKEEYEAPNLRFSTAAATQRPGTELKKSGGYKKSAKPYRVDNPYRETKAPGTGWAIDDGPHSTMHQNEAEARGEDQEAVSDRADETRGTVNNKNIGNKFNREYNKSTETKEFKERYTAKRNSLFNLYVKGGMGKAEAAAKADKVARRSLSRAPEKEMRKSARERYIERARHMRK